MPDGGETKIVHFHEYCRKCAYKDRKEDEDPCYECVEDPVAPYSHKPRRYKEKE